MTARQRDNTSLGEALFLSVLGLIDRVIEFVCRRHRLNAADADDFASHVKLRLIEDDYAILTKFQGRSCLRTYLTVVIQRMFNDYRVAAWGKWRPSAEAKRAGAIGILFERLTLRDGLGFEEACELMRTNHRIDASRAKLERIAERLPMRPRRRLESEDALKSERAGGRAVDALVQDPGRQQLADRVSGIVSAHLARLDAQDRLVLVLHFEGGRTVADIAAMLGLHPKRLYRRIERLLKELRKAFDRAGIDAASVLDMLESPAVVVDWSGRLPGEPVPTTPSPSVAERGIQSCPVLPWDRGSRCVTDVGVRTWVRRRPTNPVADAELLAR